MKKSIIFFTLLLTGTVGMQLSACNKKNNVDADSTLTDSEKQSLAFMIEEEKMAYDVYTLMYSHWGLTPFQNIKESESRHMASVRSLMTRYGVPDPSAGNRIGAFSNPLISQLFLQLTAKGDSSELLALTAGAIIEEVDIRDLKEQLLLTNKQDIRQVYENLMRGSRNHLRAFVEQLSLKGITYQPAYLSRDEYDAIINSPKETGARRNAN